MDQDNEIIEQEPRPKKPLAIRLAPIIVIAVVVAVAASVLSRPMPGQKTSTDTSVTLVVNTADANKEVTFPITLQEGGDPAHESDHIFEPLLGEPGIATTTLDWSSGVVISITYDSESVSESEIGRLLAESGYLTVPQ